MNYEVAIARPEQGPIVVLEVINTPKGLAIAANDCGPLTKKELLEALEVATDVVNKLC